MLLAAQIDTLSQQCHGLQLRLIAVCTSRRQLLASPEYPVDISCWQSQLQGAVCESAYCTASILPASLRQQKSQPRWECMAQGPADLEKFTEHMTKQGCGALVIDCTASRHPTEYYSRCG